MTDLIILEKPIRQQNGLYCLNDLHKASGSSASKKPSEWIRLVQTTELIKELSEAGIPTSEQNQQVIKTFKGGHFTGTYACRELVLAYATWISPAFFLTVLRTFDRVSCSGSLNVQQPRDVPPQSLEEARELAWRLSCAKYDLELRLAQSEPWLRYWCEVDLVLHGF